jgi:hypothetical protein
VLRSGTNLALFRIAGGLSSGRRDSAGCVRDPQGHDNTTIAKTLVITERAVSKHIGNVFLKLGLPDCTEDSETASARLDAIQG